MPARVSPKNLYRSWVRFSEMWGAVMMTALFGLCYLTVFALFSPLVRLSDPLRLSPRSRERASHWKTRRPTVVDHDFMKRLG